MNAAPSSLKLSPFVAEKIKSLGRAKGGASDGGTVAGSQVLPAMGAPFVARRNAHRLGAGLQTVGFDLC